MTRFVVFCIVTVSTLVGAPTAYAIWAAQNSGTTDTISAIEYQSADRFWYATTNGRLAYRQGGTFSAGAGPPAGVIFNDIAFQSAQGNVGIAVGNSNQVWRSTDGGRNWSPLVLPATINNDDCFGMPGVGMSAWDIGYGVIWADASIVYLVGNRGNIMKSVDAGATFLEVNKKTDVSDGRACFVGSISSNTLTDGVFTNATNGYLISRNRGTVWFTDSGVATNATMRADAVNNFDGVPRIALDPGNPNRMWVVDRCECLSHSQDGGVTFPFGAATIRNRAGERLAAPHDIGFAAGTVLLAGSAGQIATSIDGVNFYYQDAASPLATADWKAVDLADPANGAVGGAGGALVTTAAANTVPDIDPPTGTIAGPDRPVAGQRATYTVNAADNPGGKGIDPTGFAWSAPGVAPASGQTVGLIFPRSGRVTIRVTFRDLAGNTAEATRTVNVQAAQAQVKQRQRVTARVRPRRDRRAPFRFTVSGRVIVPAGVARSEVCAGRVTISYYAGRRRLVRLRIGVRSTCAFRVRTTFRSRRSFRRARSLRIVITKPATANTLAARAVRLQARVR